MPRTSSRKCAAPSDLLRAHLRGIRSPWRLLPPGEIALIVLAYLRHDQRLADLAGGNQISASTLRRWANELIDLLVARSPRLDRALKKINQKVRGSNPFGRTS